MTTTTQERRSPQHPAALYHATRLAECLPNLSVIGQAALVQYERLGYIAVAEAFSSAEVEAARDGISSLVAGEHAEFHNIEFEAHAKDRLAAVSPEERLDLVRKLMDFTWAEPRLKAMAANPMLLAVLRQVLGAEPQILQEMALLKPPLGREKPWHQDNAYFDIPPGTPVAGVWIALDEVSVANGCMHLMAGEHKCGAMTHFKRRDWQICDSEMLGRGCVAVPLRPGGCLIFNGLLPHGTPDNLTQMRRRAVQFHYVPRGTGKAAPELRLAAFGSEGKNVTC